MTDIDICNIALTKLGQNTIISFNDETENARKLNIIYYQTKKALLREHIWNFANRTEILTLTAIDDDNWKYIYIYPPNCLYIDKIFNISDEDLYFDFEILNINNQKYIATNLEQARIKYICDIINPNVYDNLFIECLINKLAGDLAQSITGNLELSSIFYSLYQETLAKAKTFTVREKRKVFKKKNGYLECR